MEISLSQQTACLGACNLNVDQSLSSIETQGSHGVGSSRSPCAAHHQFQVSLGYGRRCVQKGGGSIELINLSIPALITEYVTKLITLHFCISPSLKDCLLFRTDNTRVKCLQCHTQEGNGIWGKGLLCLVLSFPTLPTQSAEGRKHDQTSVMACCQNCSRMVNHS